MNILTRLSWRRPRGPLAHLPAILGFRPRNLAYYQLAFRHSSCSLEGREGLRINNERLEFLGDSVLATAMSHYLYDKHPLWDEGQMSQRRGALVKRAVNNMIAEEMGLGGMLLARQDIRRMSPDVYGNTLEALIGAIFLDRGYLYAERFVHDKFLPIFHALEQELEDQTTNYKSELIEWVQKHHLELEYKMEHEPKRTGGLFVCVVYVTGQRIGLGKGASKKDAHQAASHYALDVLRKADRELDAESRRTSTTNRSGSNTNHRKANADRRRRNLSGREPQTDAKAAPVAEAKSPPPDKKSEPIAAE